MRLLPSHYPLLLLCFTLFTKTTAAMTTTTNKNKSRPKPKPALPIPSPLLSLTPGTWAYDTMSRRVNEEILQRTWEENETEFTEMKVTGAFEALRKDLSNAGTTQLTFLDESSSPDAVELAQWRDILSPFIISNKDTWLSAPWCVTEFYVYRRLMQAIGYFDPSSKGYQYDPFAKEKLRGLHSSVASAEGVLDKITSLSQTSDVATGLAIASAFCLWGNKMDLSIWPTNSSAEDLKLAFDQILSNSKDNLLHDDTATLIAYCQELHGKGGGNIDIIVDNAGFELVVDLCMADYLVASGVAKSVTFQLKAHPTFVSDALEHDLKNTVEYFASLDAGEYPHGRAAGERWLKYLNNQDWVCHEDNFWVQPLPMWQMHDDIFDDLNTRCDLAFVKGDANYRRLLGDCEWDYSAASFDDVVGAYFPCAVCALRTLKAEVGCGMEAKQVERAKELDPKGWMVTGRFGVVHFGKGCGER
mmetsp:Transcript_7297/g.10768  ORF Transcript_7297/g.10768 Transcript_7297/m.10768 type:complete len:472 (-) Transcript_7297:104-1519(-)